MQASRSLVRRACDACKRRKVKCDTERPCANCRISRMECAYTIPQRKRGPRTIPGAGSPQCLPPLTPTSPHSHEIQSSDYSGNGNPSPPNPSTGALWVASINDVQDTAEGPTCFQSIHKALGHSLQSAVRFPLTGLDVANRCIDLYMQYTFPAAPLVHEPTLRNGAKLFFSETSAVAFPAAKDEHKRMSFLRAFALVTALCASVASVMPDMLVPHGKALVEPFLHASRETLRSFEDYDLEHPSSASMTIRLFHSTALQHATGRSGAAWHVHGQAALIAQNLRLYREQAVAQGGDAVESQLLRLHFWHMYASDQVAAVFQARAVVLDETLFHEALNLQPNSKQGAALTDPNKPQYDEGFETRLLTGFYLWQSVSCRAAKIVLRMRRQSSPLSESETRILMQEYLEFTMLVDGLPTWLQTSHLAASETSATGSFYERSFWVQRCTILTTYHCLRLVILRQSIRSGMWAILGLSDSPDGMAMKSIEMISDILHVLEDIPLVYLQVKGEPTVERIRQVGSILLELLNTVGNEHMKSRAQAYCRRLLDILAALNSKASDHIAFEA